MERANIRHGFPIKVVQIHDDCGCDVVGRSAGVRGTDEREQSTRVRMRRRRSLPCWIGSTR